MTAMLKQRLVQDCLFFFFLGISMVASAQTCAGVDGAKFEVVGDRHILISRDGTAAAILLLPFWYSSLSNTNESYQGNLQREGVKSVRFFSPTICNGQRFQLNGQTVKVQEVQIMRK